jgi:hypothetical protein
MQAFAATRRELELKLCLPGALLEEIAAGEP